MDANRQTVDALRSIGRVRRPREVIELGLNTMVDKPFADEIDALAAAIRAGKPLLVVGERGSGRLSRLRARGGAARRATAG